MQFICLDVANGYSQFFVEFVAKVRGKFPEHTIMVSQHAKQTFASRLVSLMEDLYAHAHLLHRLILAAYPLFDEDSGRRLETRNNTD